MYIFQSMQSKLLFLIDKYYFKSLNWTVFILIVADVEQNYPFSINLYFDKNSTIQDVTLFQGIYVYKISLDDKISGWSFKVLNCTITLFQSNNYIEYVYQGWEFFIMFNIIAFYAHQYVHFKDTLLRCNLLVYLAFQHEKEG